MIVASLRSSSILNIDFCEQQYALTYMLGLSNPSGSAAKKGTICHRCLQLLADCKLTLDAGKKTVINDDIPNLRTSTCNDIEKITKICFDYYNEHLEPYLEEKDLRECTKWVHKALDYNDGELDPRNQNVFKTEDYFELEVKKDWSKYDFTVNGKRYQGNLVLKGTVDLVLTENENTLQILDYKTGKRKNWATGEVKEYKDFFHDSQLLLYFYVLRNRYPDKNFILSIYYINDGGLFEFAFGEEEYNRAEEMIRQKFEYIKSVKVPKRISWENDHWKCQRLCAFSKPSEVEGKTICQLFNDRFYKDGIQKTFEEHGDVDKLFSYGAGGGRLDNDESSNKK